MLFTLYVRELLEAECDVEADCEEEAFEKIEQMYNESKIVLDHSNLINIAFSSFHASEREMDIVNETFKFCGRECNSRECCQEEECILFRIQKMILGDEIANIL